MRNVKISHKFLILIGAGSIGTAIAAALLLMMLKSVLLEDRKDKTRNLVETAYTVLAHYAAQESAGAMSREQAQTAAKAAVKALRYNKDDYFWINDYAPKMVMHPFKPELDGKDLAQFEDKKGTKLFVEFVKTVRNDGAGFVFYYWPKPNAQETVQKLSYVKGFQPWGWIIGSGIYIHDVGEVFAEKATQAAGFILVVLCGLGCASFFLARSVRRPLAALSVAMTRIAQGDLDAEMDLGARRDEIGPMVEAVHVFKANAIDNRRLAAEQAESERRSRDEIRSTRLALADGFEAEVKGVVDALAGAADHLERTSQAMNSATEATGRQATVVVSASEQASGSVETVAAAAEELAASIREIGRQMSEQAAIAGDASAQAQRTQGTVTALADAASKIGAIVDLISSIAAQTNLLALNATIEAARAGDAGRGFAVVASEVKSLATQTAKATDEIAQQIGAIRDDIEGTVGATEAVVETIGKISAIAAAIAAAVEEQDAATHEIARSVEQAARGTQEVSTNIEGVTRAVGETGTTAAEVLAAARALTEQSTRMRGLVDHFLAEVRAA